VAWVAKRAGYVSKGVKGVFIALAAALALDLSADAGAAALGLVGTIIAILFANAYADWLQIEIDQSRRLGLSDVPAVAGHSVGVALGALPALLLFIAAWLGLMAIATAVDLAVWTGIAMLFALGYAAGRLQGDTKPSAMSHGVKLAVVGLGVLLIKYII